MARILIVEDEPNILLTLEEDLHRQGHDTESVRDGSRVSPVDERARGT